MHLTVQVHLVQSVSSTGAACTVCLLPSLCCNKGSPSCVPWLSPPLQESVVANLTSLDTLITWVQKRKGGREVVRQAVEALQELFCTVLLPDRKLLHFEQQPLQVQGQRVRLLLFQCRLSLAHAGVYLLVNSCWCVYHAHPWYTPQQEFNKGDIHLLEVEVHAVLWKL